MSDEIDIQQYLAAIRRRWWIVALVTVLALVVTLVLNAVQPKRYQSTATLLAQAPRFQWRFDTGILPMIDTRRDYQRELLAISRSNRIAQASADALHASGVLPAATTNSVQAAVTVRAGDGATLLVSATAGDPEQAAAIANAYSEAFLQLGQEIYGVGTDLTNFQAELETAAQRLGEWEAQLAAVRTETGLYDPADPTRDALDLSPRQQQITLQNLQLAEYRSDLANLRYLRDQLSQAGPDADLTLLPWELLDGPVISRRGVLTAENGRNGVENPEALASLLDGEIESLAATADQLEADVVALQAHFADEWQRYNTINRERNLASETYNLLSRKATEAAIQQRIDPGQLILVSEAVPPDSPAQTRQLAQLAVAGVIGLILGVIVALWVDGRARRAQTADH